MTENEVLKLGMQLVTKMGTDYEQYTTNKKYQKDVAKYKDEVGSIELEDEAYFKGDLNIADGFTAVKDDTFCVCFFSTNSKLDWLFNFWFFHKTIPYDGTNEKIKVHSGFIDAYKSVREELADRFKKSGKSKVFVCGHSLGGALTQLFALDTQYNFPEAEIDSVSFGAPKVGNSEFVRSFNGRCPNNIREAYGNEFTLSVPFNFMGFKHVDTEYHTGPARKKFGFSLNNHWPSNFIGEILKKLSN